MAQAKKGVEVGIDVMQINQGVIEVCVLGVSPLIMNTVSEKARRELLLPSGRKNAAERAQSLKHDPLNEYRASVYRTLAEKSPTRLMLPAAMFKAALSNAALDLPGASKAQIGRLCYVEGDSISVYGVPQIYSAVVRNSDMNRTPDIRTRAILPQWACTFRVKFVKPILRENAVVNLLAAAGIFVGVGDFRPQKGKGNYGQFELVGADDERYQAIVRDGGRVAQDAALDNPVAYDSGTMELLAWYGDEVKRRGEERASTPAKAVKPQPKKRNGAAAETAPPAPPAPAH